VSNHFAASLRERVTTTGFSPSVGSVLGLRIWYARFGGVGDLFSPPWATVNEYYHFDDVVLR
jgi:hypothetical protein